MPNSPNDPPLPLYQVLEEEYERLHGTPPPSRDDPPSKDQNGLPLSEVRLANIFKDIHQLEGEEKHSALCLSGGGIRSATFALGVLQGLARNKLVDKFSYLSTVSGGGYVGGWLSAWIHRHPGGTAGISEDLKKEPKTKLEPEPEPIQHLRSYSNYLTPRIGLFSADTWTLAAIILRNLILNWLVLIPMMIAVLVIPRLSAASIRNLPTGSFVVYAVMATLIFALILILTRDQRVQPLVTIALLVAFIALVTAIWYYPLIATLALGFAGGVTCITYVGVKRPSSTEDYNDQGGFLTWCLLPLLGSAVALTTFWAWFRLSGFSTKFPGEGRQLPAWLGFLTITSDQSPIPFIAFGASLYLLGWIIYSAWLGRFSVWKPAWWTRPHSRQVAEFFSMLASGAIGGLFLWLVATKVFYYPISYPDTILYYVSFAASLYLVLFLATAILFAGISSEFTEDEDREWWARFSAWVLISIVAWSVVSYLSLLGPNLLKYLNAAYVVPAGGLIGFLTTKLAQSAKAPANAKQEQEGGWRAVLMSQMLSLGAIVTIGLIIVLLTFVINYLLAILTFVLTPFITWVINEQWLLRDAVTGRAVDFNMPVAYEVHMNIIRYAPFPLLIIMVTVISLLGYFLSRLINTNKFSQHAMYRNRLIRAYLGASNEDRFPNPFTGFDPADNISMHKLRPEYFHHGSFRKEKDRNIWHFVKRLKDGDTGLSKFFRDRLSPRTIQYLEEWDERRDPSRLLQRALIKDLNMLVLKTDSLFDDTVEFNNVEAAKRSARGVPQRHGRQIDALKPAAHRSGLPRRDHPLPGAAAQTASRRQRHPESGAGPEAGVAGSQGRVLYHQPAALRQLPDSGLRGRGTKAAHVRRVQASGGLWRARQWWHLSGNGGRHLGRSREPQHGLLLLAAGDVSDDAL